MEAPGEKTRKSKTFDPETVKKNINRRWEHINTLAEIGRGPTISPFHSSDLVGAESKIPPDEYAVRPPEVEAKILGLPLDQDLKEKKILNIGAGKSTLGVVAKKMGATLIDVDPNFYPVGRIMTRYGTTPVVAKGEKLPLESKSFDEVLLPFVLCVVDDPEAILYEALRVVSPKGKIRIYPSIAFVDLRKNRLPGIKFLRQGADDFTIVIERENIPNVEEAGQYLMNTERLCVKPNDTTGKKRLSGYYYDKEHDLPEEEWWLGDLI